MDAVMAVKRGEPGAALPELRDAAGPGRVSRTGAGDRAAMRQTPRSAPTVASTTRCPTPPFWGTASSRASRSPTTRAYLDERATFMGQWGLKPSRRRGGPSYEELVETEGRPRLRMWLDRAQTEGLLEAAVVYGYFPCVSEGDDLIVLDGGGGRGARAVHLPPAAARRGACAWPTSSGRATPGETDVVGFQLVTMGPGSSEATAELFATNAYRDYLELHGLSVQLTEALAEYWHARVRAELGFGAEDPDDLDGVLRAALPRRALLARLPGLPGPGGPGQDRRAARPRADRRRAVGGVPAPPGAVHRRDRRPPPRGEVLQRLGCLGDGCTRGGPVRHGRAAR